MDICEEYEAGCIWSHDSDPRRALERAKETMRNGKSVMGVILRPLRIVLYDERGTVCEEVLP